MEFTIYDIKIIFVGQYSDDEIKSLKTEIKNALDKVLTFDVKKICVQSIVVSNKLIKDKISCNGKYNKKKREINVFFNRVEGYKKFYQTLCHELFHARFLIDMFFDKCKELKEIYSKGDNSALFLVEEHIVVRNAFLLCPNVKEIQDYLNHSDLYFLNKSCISSNKDAERLEILEFLASYILACQLFNNNIINDIKLKEISVILGIVKRVPTLEQVNRISKLLNEIK